MSEIAQMVLLFRHAEFRFKSISHCQISGGVIDFVCGTCNEQPVHWDPVCILLAADKGCEGLIYTIVFSNFTMNNFG